MRGFVITGILFGLALIMLISTNYVILAENNSTDYLVLQADAVHNRAVDVDRIITEAMDDGECGNINALLSNSLLDSQGIEVISSVNSAVCPDLNIIIQIDSDNVHKEFNKVYTGPSGP